MATTDKEGGAYGGVDDLYREVILDHFKSPKNKGVIDNADAKAEGVNPLCGDQITISLLMNGPTVTDVKYDGHGCAISQSSASMMTQLIKGKSLEEIQKLTLVFKDMFGIKIDGDEQLIGALTPDDLGDAVALEGVKKYPVRIKCAVLAWNTLLDGLNKLGKD